MWAVKRRIERMYEMHYKSTHTYEGIESEVL